jgi:hypothetical protein
MAVKMSRPRKFSCCICKDTIVDEFGNNPDPFWGGENGKACDYCNEVAVVPARMAMMEIRQGVLESTKEERDEARLEMQAESEQRAHEFEGHFPASPAH